MSGLGTILVQRSIRQYFLGNIGFTLILCKSIETELYASFCHSVTIVLICFLLRVIPGVEYMIMNSQLYYL